MVTTPLTTPTHPIVTQHAAAVAPAATHAATTGAHAATMPTMQDVAPTITAILLDNAINFVVAIIILAIGWTLATWVRRWIRGAFSHLTMLDPSLAPILGSLARYSILMLTVMAVLDRFGVQMTSLIAVIGAAGIAVGLALQGTLANVASGLMILMLRPFRAGDTISILGTEGTRGIVAEIGLFRTTITAVDYRTLSLPNSTIFSGTIVNYSQEPKYRVDMTVPIDQVNDLPRVKQVFMEVVKADRRILSAPAPIVAVSSLNEYSVTMLLRVWVSYKERNPVSWDVLEALHSRMRQEGIAIAVTRQAVSERAENGLDAVGHEEESDAVPSPAKH
ncbi:MAG TPA: mechanosensitive ion channel domain-containing protein [Rhizomicrobium sp.]|nr:mechanosensitive ion channel domain-containing protein [Rhizomicrobium sp.]